MKSRRSVRLAAAVVVCVGILAGPAAGAATAATTAPGDGKRILIYGPRLAGEVSYTEATAAQELGYTVTVADALTWATMTPASFASYNAIIFPDPDCDGSGWAAALANAPLWVAATKDGPKVISGADPVYHFNARSSQPGAKTLIIDSIRFAAGGMRTGLSVVVGCSPSYAAGVLRAIDPALAAGSKSHYTDVAKIVDPTSPVMADQTDALLSNWRSTWHSEFPAYPSNFKPVAVNSITQVPFIIADPGVSKPDPLPTGLLGSPLPADVFAVLRAAFSPY